MGDLRGTGRESANELGRESLAMAVATGAAALVEGKAIPDGSASLVPLLVNSSWPYLRWGTHRIAVSVLDTARRHTGLGGTDFAARVKSDEQLQDMVTLILREVETSGADPMHLDDLAAVLAYAVVTPSRRADARHLVKVMEQLSSQHIRWLDRLSRPAPSGGSWRGEDVSKMFGEEGRDWYFAAAALQAAGLITMGNMQQQEDGNIAVIWDFTATVTKPGEWVLEVLRDRAWDVAGRDTPN